MSSKSLLAEDDEDSVDFENDNGKRAKFRIGSPINALAINPGGDCVVVAGREGNKCNIDRNKDTFLNFAL